MLGFHSYVLGRLKVSEIAEVFQGELDLLPDDRLGEHLCESGSFQRGLRSVQKHLTFPCFVNCSDYGSEKCFSQLARVLWHLFFIIIYHNNCI